MPKKILSFVSPIDGDTDSKNVYDFPLTNYATFLFLMLVDGYRTIILNKKFTEKYSGITKHYGSMIHYFCNLKNKNNSENSNTISISGPKISYKKFIILINRFYSNDQILYLLFELLESNEKFRKKFSNKGFLDEITLTILDKISNLKQKDDTYIKIIYLRILRYFTLDENFVKNILSSVLIKKFTFANNKKDEKKEKIFKDITENNLIVCLIGEIIYQELEEKKDYQLLNICFEIIYNISRSFKIIQKKASLQLIAIFINILNQFYQSIPKKEISKNQYLFNFFSEQLQKILEIIDILLGMGIKTSQFLIYQLIKNYKNIFFNDFKWIKSKNCKILLSLLHQLKKYCMFINNKIDQKLIQTRIQSQIQEKKQEKRKFIVSENEILDIIQIYPKFLQEITNSIDIKPRFFYKKPPVIFSILLELIWESYINKK
ncbi:hypothetical protein M0813_15969 [Anaeramoeba flamelloides]|uniref:Uncharacterized protein n=1 Tax=Anaeramoeba flamelloides TaxID=1746091 RepID=A0ABQ8Z102_9EUKA|nr:hypothetical protein M0813_15969 [Anaeramoeba flamelloides]